MRNRLLEIILIPVLFAWAVVLFVHRSEPRLYYSVVSRMVCRVRVRLETIASVAATYSIRCRKADTCFKLLNTQNINVIRLLELSSNDHIALDTTDSHTRDFAA